VSLMMGQAAAAATISWPGQAAGIAQLAMFINKFNYSRQRHSQLTTKCLFVFTKIVVTCKLHITIYNFTQPHNHHCYRMHMQTTTDQPAETAYNHSHQLHWHSQWYYSKNATPDTPIAIFPAKGKFINIHST
jgi:hypothetical protein